MVGPESTAQLMSWLVSGRTLFLSIHLLGIVGFSYIVARRLVPLLRGERDFRFDRPLSATGKGFQVLAGAVEASALQDRRNPSHLHFCGLHRPGTSRFHGADCRRLPKLRHARPFRKSRTCLQHRHGLRRHHCFPLHGDRGNSPPGFQASTVRCADKVRQRPHGRCHFPSGADCNPDGRRQPLRSRQDRRSGTAGQPVEVLAALSLPWMLQKALLSASLPTLGSRLFRRLSSP